MKTIDKILEEHNGDLSAAAEEIQETVQRYAPNLTVADMNFITTQHIRATFMYIVDLIFANMEEEEREQMRQAFAEWERFDMLARVYDSIRNKLSNRITVVRDPGNA